ncbi:MAG: ParA family protein [Cyanobacteria bacterium J06639_14]
MMSQKRIAIMSNAGGTGKTTLAANLAYQLARVGKRVCLIGCDPNGSLALFTGLEDPLDRKQTLDKVLDIEFDGKWPLFPVWRERIEGIDACLGGLHLFETAKRIDQETRGAYLLADALEDHPLAHDVVILDCPGTIERYHEVALCACTHILTIMQPEYKDVDAGFKLLNWIFEWRKRLRLKPSPEVVGVVPNGYDRQTAMHREIMGDDPEYSLPITLKKMGVHLFPAVKTSRHLANASANGLPLGIWRSGEEINKIFFEIAQIVLKTEG